MKIIEPHLRVRVLGCGRSWPGEAPVTNADILRLDPENAGRPADFLDRLGERYAGKFGFARRHLACLPKFAKRLTHPPGEETTESLGLRAAQQAVAGHPELAIEALVHGTTTTTRYTGSQAPAILAQLGSHAAGYEIKAGCSTSLASLHLAVSLLNFGHDNVLVDCAETLSKVMNPALKETCYILADAGAALWLEKNDTAPDFEIRRCFYNTDGNYVDMYTTQGKLPPNQHDLDHGGYLMFGDGAKLREQAFRRYTAMIEAMFPGGKGLERIKWLVPHQINRTLIDEVCAATGLIAERIWDADQFGNVGGTSVLFSLAGAIEQQRFQPGDEILLMSVGGGLSYAIQHWVRL